ncbi:MAG: hypothetical protein HY819_11190 [Acidobacteria bacterium]|nr:hypothetical protein [Acidobacteriota bacterium]
MSISARQFVSQGQQRLLEVQSMLSGLGNTFEKHGQTLVELQNIYNQTLDELVQINLPNLSQEAFSQVRQYTGYGQFDVKNPFITMNEEHTRLTQLISDIDLDERYLRQDELVNPISGELILKADSIRQNFNLLRDSLQRYESEPRFLHLIQSAYDTPDYTGRMWQLDYYRDWRTGSSISKKFGKHFYEIRSDYLPLKQAHDHTYNELAEAEKEINDVKNLVNLRGQSLYRLNNLPQVILQESQAALRQHLQYVDKEQLFSWAQGDHAREALIKKLDGVEKKLNYLKEMVAYQQQQEQTALQEYIYKLNKKVVKFQRPKYYHYTVSSRDAAILYIDPKEKLFHKRNKFWKSYDVVFDFDDYDYYDYQKDMLWWDLMTDGEIDGNYINEVNHFYSNHPGYSYRHDYYYETHSYHHHHHDNDLTDFS